MQNGLHPITAYHLLFPTQSSLMVPPRSNISDKNLTSSTSSLSSSTSTAENDLTTPVQTISDPSIFLSTTNQLNENLSSTLTNGIKSRAGTTSSMTHHERSGSIINDSDAHRRESFSVNPGNNHSTINTFSNTDEKEVRRIIDIQCKIKTKETGLHLVNYSSVVKFLMSNMNSS